MLADLEAFLEAASVAQKWRRLRRVEKAMRTDLGVAFREQGKLFTDRFATLEYLFQESVTPDAWLPFWDEVATITHDLFWDPIQAGARTSLQAGADDTIAEIGRLAVDVAFSLDHPVAVEYLRRHSAEMVTRINETTRQSINTIVTNGVQEGHSYDRMAKALTDRFEEFAVGKPQQHIRSRAHLIAITEAGNAYEAGSRAVVDDLAAAGLTMEKKWLTVGDARVSDGCRENQDAGWILVDREFPSGHQQPLRFPGCRCACLYQRRGS